MQFLAATVFRIENAWRQILHRKALGTFQFIRDTEGWSAWVREKLLSVESCPQGFWGQKEVRCTKVNGGAHRFFIIDPISSLQALSECKYLGGDKLGDEFAGHSTHRFANKEINRSIESHERMLALFACPTWKGDFGQGSSHKQESPDPEIHTGLLVTKKNLHRLQSRTRKMFSHTITPCSPPPKAHIMEKQV